MILRQRDMEGRRKCVTRGVRSSFVYGRRKGWRSVPFWPSNVVTLYRVRPLFVNCSNAFFSFLGPLGCLCPLLSYSEFRADNPDENTDGARQYYFKSLKTPWCLCLNVRHIEDRASLAMNALAKSGDFDLSAFVVRGHGYNNNSSSALKCFDPHPPNTPLPKKQDTIFFYWAYCTCRDFFCDRPL